ncbi:hypothetical protein ACSU6B_21395 [Neobacillus sp. C211]|uniref:hypothetical protein n=1 Tax=unclassified Neobacillus TaxID=2675272 RepID=UPI00397E284D
MAEKAFLGSLMKAEYLLRDPVIQPEQLESTRHKELMRKLCLPQQLTDYLN